MYTFYRIRLNWRRLALSLMALATSVSMVSATPTQAVTLARCKVVEVVAHRGLSDAKHTENTIRSFRHAYRSGINYLEADIRITKEGEWVFMHDERVARTTNGTGKVSAQTVPKLKTYKTNDGVEGGIPTLAEGMKFMQKRPSAHMQLEIKTETTDVVALTKILATAKAMGVTSQLMFISFDPTTLEKLHSLDPSIAVGLISPNRVSAKTAAKFDRTVLVKQDAVSSAYVRDMHQANVQVHTWTVNNQTEWKNAVLDNVDGITSDNPRALKQHCART